MVDFAAAQQRVLLRRQREAAESQAQLQAAQLQRATAVPSRLPFPFGPLGTSALEAWDAIKGREGTRPAFRVGQVDAELLDEELVGLLMGQARDALKYYGGYVSDDWSAEIMLVLRAVLFKISVWDHNISYGAALQNLRYTDARHQGVVPRDPSRWQKGLYGAASVGGRYIWGKWEDWLVGWQGGYDQPTERVRLLSRITSIMSTTHSIAAFVSFLAFLINGRYRTLLDRILRLRLATPDNQVRREVDFEYLNRQLVWHAFTEFLLFFLPLVGISRWRRWIARFWRQTKGILRSQDAQGEEVGRGELAFLPERTCAICYQDQNPTSTSENELLAVAGHSGGLIGSGQTDITNPYETLPCACVYCFVCIATRLESEEGQGWPCLRCGELVTECQPWAGDVVLDANSSSNRKVVAFSAAEAPKDIKSASGEDDGG